LSLHQKTANRDLKNALLATIVFFLIFLLVLLVFHGQP
jgi:hypothetical protein